MRQTSRYKIAQNLCSKKNRKKLRLIKSYLAPLALKTQKRTHTLFSLVKGRNMNPISQYNIGGNLSSRKN